MRTPSWRPVLALLCLALAAPAASQAATPTGLKAEYFANETLSGPPSAERVDPTVDFAWEASEPAPGIDDDEFSVRWTGTITPRHSETYTLTTRTDDGVRLYVDGTLVIDDWAHHAVKDNQAEVALVAGHRHAIRMEFYEHRGRAEARLRWKSASQASEIVPTDRLAPPGAVGVPPVGEEIPPVVEEIPPVVEEIPPVVEEIPPVVEETPVVEGVEPDLTAIVEKVGDALPIIDASVPAQTATASILPPPAPPVAGEHFNAQPVGGEVLVRRPEDGALIPLQEGASLPVGTRIDTREGAVVVQTAPAVGVDGATQDAAFEGAMFRVTQPAGGKRIVGIDLAHGDFESCHTSTRRGRARSAAAGDKRKSKHVRRLFGKGKGRFRTRGRFAAATVRGTTWIVADNCNETVTRVEEGVVDVENLVTGRVVEVSAGERYAARGPRR